MLCPALHTLALTDHEDLFSYLSPVSESISSLGSLTNLDLSETMCDDDHLGLIVDGCGLLSMLSLRKCSELRSLQPLKERLDSSVACLSHLSRLDLDECDGLTDDAVQTLARVASQPDALLLRSPGSHLALQRCRSLTSEGVRALAHGPPKMGMLMLHDSDEDVLETAVEIAQRAIQHSLSTKEKLDTLAIAIIADHGDVCRFLDDGEQALVLYASHTTKPRSAEPEEQQSNWNMNLMCGSKLKREYAHLVLSACN